MSKAEAQRLREEKKARAKALKPRRAQLTYIILKEVSEKGGVEVARHDLAAVGLPPRSKAYADWLWDIGVRMIECPGKYIPFVRRMPPVDLAPIMERYRHEWQGGAS